LPCTQGTPTLLSNSVRRRTDDKTSQPVKCEQPARPYAHAQVLRPVQVVTTDEGLNSLDVHLSDDTSKSLQAQPELVCPSDEGVTIASTHRAIERAPRSNQRISVADPGQFFDVTYAYRFGPRAHDLAIARRSGR
jgi:beta-mannosidase